jgi:hypothetical protein
MTSEPPGWSSPAPASAPAARAPVTPGWGPATVAPGWGPGPMRRLEPQPGVVPLRPLGIGEIIDGAISTMRRHWKLQLGLSAAVVTAVSVLQAGALYLLYRDTAGLESGGVTGPEPDAGVAANAAELVTLAIGQLAQMVLLGILVFVVSRAVLGEDVTPSQAWTAVKPYLWRLIGLSVLVMVMTLGLISLPVLIGLAVYGLGAGDVAAIGTGVVAGLVLLPAGVWLWVRLGVAAPALVLEKLGIVASMRRSGRLVRRSWWRVFGVLVLSTVISSVLGGIISLPFTVGALLSDWNLDGSQAPGVWFYVLTTLGSAVAGTITYPFTAGVAALLYIDLRMRREALDLTLIRAARASSRPEQPR